MKAFRCMAYGGPEVLKMVEEPKPVIKEDELLIKLNYTIVSPVDCEGRKGEHPVARLITGLLKPKNILGDVYGGVVEEVGAAVTKFSVGDVVYGTLAPSTGANAEYVKTKQDVALTTLPEGVTLEDVVPAADGGLTALPFLRDTGNLKKGQRVLIIGASGSVGSYGVQFAKLMGAHVTAVCSGANAEWVKSLGADEVIDYTKTDYTKALERYHVVFDAVAKSGFKACKGILEDGGVYMTTVPDFGTMLRTLFKVKSDGKRGVFAATGLRKPVDKLPDMAYMNDLFAKGELKTVIDRTYNFDQMAEAHAYVDKGHKKGSVLIKVS